MMALKHSQTKPEKKETSTDNISPYIFKACECISFTSGKFWILSSAWQTENSPRQDNQAKWRHTLLCLKLYSVCWFATCDRLFKEISYIISIECYSTESTGEKPIYLIYVI